MRKIIWFAIFIVLLALSSGYIFEKERDERAMKVDTVVSVKSKRDTMFFVVNYIHDTIDWWGHYNGQFVSRKGMDCMLRRVDSLAFYLGYTPYIGYTLLNPKFWYYLGQYN